MAKNRYIPNELPLSIRENPKFRAEVLVYDELKAQLDAKQRDWIVVYQANWLRKDPGHNEPKEGEADFVLAHPKRGVLVVEVKGGKPIFREGQWYSRDRRGEEHKIDPFSQVARNAWNLVKKFNELPNLKGSPISKLGRLVVFPDGGTPPGAIYPSDVTRDIVIDRPGLGDVVEGILTASRFWFGEKWSHPRADRVGAAIVELFARPLEFTDSLGADLPLETRRFEQLTDDQFRVVQAVAKLPRVVIQGGAGSGKTWLARKRALQLHSEGFRTLLTCRSVPLAQHLQSITSTEDELVILPYEQLLERLFKAPSLAHTSLSREEYGWKLIEQAELVPDLRFDAIMVDEGQDFQADEWVFVEGLLREAQQGILYIFLDDNQQVYSHQTAIPENMVTLQLGDNVRTTRSIHDHLVNFYHSDPPQRSLGPLGRQVQFVEMERDVAQTTRQVVSRLIDNDQIRPDDIVVLTPCDPRSSCLDALSLTHGRKLKADPRPDLDVRLASIEAFKGLESAVVVLSEADSLPADPASRLRFCYTAFSRPRSHLVVLGDWSPPPSSH